MGGDLVFPLSQNGGIFEKANHKREKKGHLGPTSKEMHGIGSYFLVETL